ncbi:MOSC N-terminal beta barrel domain-containing protein, partial [Actinoplanes utahensis]
MQITEIRRYPVKSMLGEQIPAAVLGARGLTGDRLWAVRDADGKFGSGKNTRRFRRIPSPPATPAPGSIPPRLTAEPLPSPGSVPPVPCLK